jgi:hypothetical protein
MGSDFGSSRSELTVARCVVARVPVLFPERRDMELKYGSPRQTYIDAGLK